MCETYDLAPQAIRDLARQAEAVYRLSGETAHRATIYELCFMIEDTFPNRRDYHHVLKWFDQHCQGCATCEVVCGLARSLAKAA